MLEPGSADGQPILLSQSAHEFARDVLQDRPSQPRGEVHVPHTLGSMGTDRDIIVHPIDPQNVVTQAIG
jgi:hypothetical protein